MKKWIAVALALAISMTVFAKQPIRTVFNTFANAEIVIESDGRVSDVKFVGPKLGSALESLLAAKIKAPSLFQVGRLNGKPARTHSLVTLQLRAESDLKNKQTLFSLHNISVSTMMLPNNRNRLAYPENMLRNLREADVLVKVSYDANGEVTSAHVDESRAKVHLDFERSALRFARKLKFFVERVGGLPQGGSAFIPVNYKIAGISYMENYTFTLPSGARLNMQPGEPESDVVSTEMNASLTKPFVPQALTGG